MKIQFPNPTDFCGREELFFEQLELSIFHAKKSWRSLLNQSIVDGKEKPWIKFGFEDVILDAIDKVDPDQEICQEISIEIMEL